MIKNIGYSFFTQVLPLISSIFLIPPLILGLGDERFGLLTLSWVFLGYFSLFNLGIGRATTKYVAEFMVTGRLSEIPTLVKTSWVLLILLGLVGGFCLFLVTPLLIENMLDFTDSLAGEAFNVFVLLAVSVPLVIFTTGIRAVLEAFGRFQLIAFISAPAGIMNYLLPYLILDRTNRLDTIVFVLLLSRIFFLMIYLLTCVRILPDFRRGSLVDAAMMVMLVRFGGWLTVSNIIGPIMTYLDRFIVGTLVSISAVTYYVTPYEIVSRLRVFPASLMPVLFPSFSGLAAEDLTKAANLFHRSVRFLWLLTIPIMVGIAAASKDILTVWINEDFAVRSAAVLSILAIGSLLNYGAQVAYNWIQSAGYAHITAFFHLIELPIFLGLSWFLVLRFGIVGVALAWFIRVVLDTVLLFWFSLRLLPKGERNITYFLSLASLGLGYYAVLGFALQFVRNSWASLLTAVVILATYPIIAWLFYLNQDEKELISKTSRIR